MPDNNNSGPPVDSDGRPFLAESGMVAIERIQCGAVSGDGHRCRLKPAHRSVEVEGVKNRRGEIRHITDEGRTFATAEAHESDGVIAEVVDLIEDVLLKHGERAARKLGSWLARRLGGLL